MIGCPGWDGHWIPVHPITSGCYRRSLPTLHNNYCLWQQAYACAFMRWETVAVALMILVPVHVCHMSAVLVPIAHMSTKPPHIAPMILVPIPVAPLSPVLEYFWAPYPHPYFNIHLYLKSVFSSKVMLLFCIPVSIIPYNGNKFSSTSVHSYTKECRPKAHEHKRSWMV